MELNPVRAGIVCAAELYTWSSASAHISGKDDKLVKVGPLIEMVGDWQEFLSGGNNEKIAEVIRSHERTGRPIGNESFIEYLERKLNRSLQKRKPGPKRIGRNN